MPATLSCTISKIPTIPNKVNADMIAEYLEYMRDNGASERHQNNALKAVIAYAKFLGEKTTFYDINTKEESMLNNEKIDPRIQEILDYQAAHEQMLKKWNI
jgi:site-specific recombinase XerD